MTRFLHGTVLLFALAIAASVSNANGEEVEVPDPAGKWSREEPKQKVAVTLANPTIKGPTVTYSVTAEFRDSFNKEEIHRKFQGKLVMDFAEVKVQKGSAGQKMHFFAGKFSGEVENLDGGKPGKKSPYEVGVKLHIPDADQLGTEGLTFPFDAKERSLTHHIRAKESLPRMKLTK